MLTFDTREASNADGPLLVLMHGRGSNRFDLQSLGKHIPDRFRVVFPEAPFDAAPWGYGSGSAWYRFLGRNKPEPESFTRTLGELEQLLAHLNAKQVVLGGFSQGGTVSIAYALANPGTVAGVVNFSGFLADHPQVATTAQNVGGTRFFWGHGTQDGNIPFELAIEGRAALVQAGADVTAHDYEIGHWIDPRELADAVAWLERVV